MSVQMASQKSETGLQQRIGRLQSVVPLAHRVLSSLGAAWLPKLPEQPGLQLPAIPLVLLRLHGLPYPLDLCQRTACQSLCLLADALHLTIITRMLAGRSTQGRRQMHVDVQLHSRLAQVYLFVKGLLHVHAAWQLGLFRGRLLVLLLIWLAATLQSACNFCANALHESAVGRHPRVSSHQLHGRISRRHSECCHLLGSKLSGLPI